MKPLDITMEMILGQRGMPALIEQLKQVKENFGYLQEDAEQPVWMPLVDLAAALAADTTAGGKATAIDWTDATSGELRLRSKLVRMVNNKVPRRSDRIYLGSRDTFLGQNHVPVFLNEKSCIAWYQRRDKFPVVKRKDSDRVRYVEATRVRFPEGSNYANDLTCPAADMG